MHITSMHIMPAYLRERELHVIGAGSLGRRIVDSLCACGFPLHVWDFDRVEERNLDNQRYRRRDVADRAFKVDALIDQLSETHADARERIFPHYERVTDATPLSGIVMMAVDSMQARGEILLAVRMNERVSFVTDGRIGPDGGKAYGFDPCNDLHLETYSSETHFRKNPQEVLAGCKGASPMPLLADITAGHVVARLAEWFHLEEGADVQYMNFYGFCFKPTYGEVREYWDE